MSVFVKPKLKALKECLGKKDWPGVEKNASAVLDFESSNYNARVFLALAQFHLEKFDESEEGYKKAIESAPSQPLARQGLTTFYEKRQRWSDYARGLQELMQLFIESRDAPKYAETLEKLLDVRRKHGTKEELIDTLSDLLPSATSYPLLRALPPYNATAPETTNYPTVQQAIASPLPVFLEVISLISDLETSALENEIKKRRQRLGGPSLTAEETRRQVQAEQLPSSKLPALWQAVLSDPDAADNEPLRRDIEKKLLGQLRTTLQSLPSSFDPPAVDLSTKAKAKSTQEIEAQEHVKGYYRQQVEELARGMALIGVPDASAWEISVEWSDGFASPLEFWPAEAWGQLARYGDVLPESPVTRVAALLRQRIEARRAQPVTDDADEPVESPKEPSEEEIADSIEAGLAAAPTSLVLHLLAATFYLEEQEWEAFLQVSESGLSVAARLESEIGRPLARSKRALETHLAVALVNHNPPSHHLRALRLLDSLLATPPPNPFSPKTPPTPHPDPALLIAKAQVLQSSEKYGAAISAWDQVLKLDPSQSPISPASLNQAKGERAWALHLSGKSEEAKEMLEEVVKAFEERKLVRDQERDEQERFRSKRGLERPEGVEEGEQEQERLERARGWWRLGECLSKLSDSDNGLSEEVYKSFISSLKASPSYAPAFTSLGLYYRTLPEPDWERSSKCFQKAFELDPSQEVAAKYLAEEFAELSEWSLVEVIARRVIDGNKGKAGMGGKAAARLAWAWKAIGGAELNSKKYPQAIVAFQSALRGTPEDVTTWIKLGVAYRHSGKHVAAIKVFVKALAFDPSSWYAKYSIADVQREIGLLEPAITAFREILADRPEELGVRVVLAETALQKGLEELRAGFTARAEESLIEALRQAVTIIEGATAIRVAWKVTADALSGLSRLSEFSLEEDARSLAVKVADLCAAQDVDAKIEGSSVVTLAVIQPNIDTLSLSVLLSALAVTSYKMRVLLESQNELAIGAGWYDLGVSISSFRPRLAAFADSQITAEQALQQAIRCLKFALHKEPLNSTFWNALGVLSFDLSPRLAQHCFIRSIEHNSRTAVPWTNLGLFYLVHGDEDLANQAFLKAQVLDPEWTAAWVGQATLADMAGHALEASVLLEHAFSIPGGSPEADIAYASRALDKYRSTVPSSSACTAAELATPTPSAVEALSGPLFALTRYLAQRPTDHNALHLNALVLEQVGDLESASVSFEKAASILEELYEVDESPAVEGQYVIAQTNLGRVRLASRNYEGAIEAFDAALSLLDLEASGSAGGLTQEQSLLLYTECKIGSALAQFSLDEPETAKELLERALEDLEVHTNADHYRNHLIAALARFFWAEDDEDGALATLMDSPALAFKRDTPLFIRRLLHAHAVAANDTSLLQSATRANSESAVKYDADLSRLQVLACLVKNDYDGALSTVSRRLHAFPWATVMRSKVAYLLFTLPPLSTNDEPTRLKPAQTLEEISANIDINARLVRARVDKGGEEASSRSRRMRFSGAIKLVEAHEQQREELDEQALILFEKSVFFAPWDTKAREKLVSAAEAVPRRDEPEVVEEKEQEDDAVQVETV
ncbi:SKI complex subunit tetratricopeptide repeat protein SKI3 [Sporobolomyces koalae]|uniref:SKI complex subunit tetratricopeptide repeat protein SKI3 n=1 Tax=Sporobolomyces koalae TaxID=500713 RepID=UPI003172D2C5